MSPGRERLREDALALLRPPLLTGAALAFAQAVPALSALGPLRRATMPRLAGRGSPASVALTFDDGPDPVSTPLFLDALERHGWRATFFVLGIMARQAPGLVREIEERGHEVALHGDRHVSHLLRSPADIADDLNRSAETVTGIVGHPPRWFRPPYGVLSATTLLSARRLGMTTVLWTAWGRDWRREATPATVVADLERTGLGPGATLLLHDADCTSAPEAWRATLGALDALAPLLAARELSPSTLSSHLGPRATGVGMTRAGLGESTGSS
jgi:peptidoglycan/xylan/chitin deacetylase (PgdA/CDA1 family)